MSAPTLTGRVNGPFFIPDQALVFKTRNHNVFAPGTLVQLVGFGRAQREDRERDDHDVFIWAQPVFLKDMDGGPDEEYWPESWRYFREDLIPLTPAARVAYKLVLRQQRSVSRSVRR